MRASADPGGMTDDDLAAAEHHHRTIAGSYRRLSEQDDSQERAKAYADLAERHETAAKACRAEAAARRRAE